MDNVGILARIATEVGVGVNLSNVADYLAVPEIVCCGGTWIVPKDALASGDYGAIEKLAADASALVKQLRSGK